MSQPWSYLLYRYGEEVAKPTLDQFRLAASELFNENAPGMTEADYAEHEVASLRYGHDDGPMYLLQVTRSGIATLEEWADQDFNTPLAAPRTISNLSEQGAVDLWCSLSQGDIAAVRRMFLANQSAE